MNEGKEGYMRKNIFVYISSNFFYDVFVKKCVRAIFPREPLFAKAR